jgi:hypothetical protein
MNTSRTSVTSLLLLLVPFVFMTACSSGNQKIDKLTKKWEYDKVNVNGQEMSADQIGSPTMEFKKDKTYNMDFGGRSEQGEWSLNGDSLTTVSNKNDQQQTLFIKELKKDQMIVEGEAQQGKMTITLVPFTGEDEGKEEEEKKQKSVESQSKGGSSTK